MTHYGDYASTAADPQFLAAVTSAAAAHALKIQASDLHVSGYDNRMHYGRTFLANPSGLAPAVAMTVATYLRADSSFMEQDHDTIVARLDEALDSVWDALAGVTPAT